MTFETWIVGAWLTACISCACESQSTRKGGFGTNLAFAFGVSALWPAVWLIVLGTWVRQMMGEGGLMELRWRHNGIGPMHAVLEFRQDASEEWKPVPTEYQAPLTENEAAFYRASHPKDNLTIIS